MYKENVWIDAIGQIDDRYLNKYFSMKQHAADEKKNKKILINLVAIAACLAVAFSVMPIYYSLRGSHHSSIEEEMFARTNTYCNSYEELAAVIGNDTLLKNIDYSALDGYTVTHRIIHEPDNVNDFSTVSFAIETENEVFGVGIYFPPHKDRIYDNSEFGEKIIEYKGKKMYFFDRTSWGNGDRFTYYYMIEFEHNECLYTISAYAKKAMANDGNFWLRLDELLGE